MKVKALHKVYHDSDVHDAGEVFSVDKKTADDLIEKDVVVSMEAKKDAEAQAKKGK